MTRKSISLSIAAALYLSAQSLFAQVVQYPLISAFYSLDGGTTNAYRWMALDPPMTLTVDGTGRPHLGVSLDKAPFSLTLNNYVRIVPAPTGPGLCHPGEQAVPDASYKYFCPVDGRWRRESYQSDWK